MNPVVIGFIGRSGMGKTTLVTQLTRRLRDRGFHVAVIKDAHHQVDWDQPGKDTYRYRRAGAQTVILRTPRRYFIQKTAHQRPELQRLLSYVQDHDIIFVEGFKQEGSYPKFEVYRQGVSRQEPLYRSILIQGLITEKDTSTDFAGPCFDINAVDAFISYLLTYYIKKEE